ncbi:amino acid ABC transporter permease [Enterovirga aerilata]|uniref:Amino acid ABC transporter permease n=1 Tax=Enterovirga aerilata TaxID=2730920 RepID=A0A849I404_9HYPH|nr:amino acid ABC transporter permease [Enterovirga sp. DB1703]NNM70870.1 amino acid ABC transporter permease [Enterovirga sp. DB1703]
MPFDFGFVVRNLPVFLDGLFVTIQLSALAFVLSLLWGLVVVGLRRSDSAPVRNLAAGYIQAVRNTPVLVQMYFIFFGSGMAGYPLSGFVAGLLALTLQNGGYVAEIYRAGIDSVSRRQTEAGLALGMLRRQAFFIVTLPQALRRVVAPISNQGVTIIKDTALVSTISVAEMTQAGRLLADRTAAVYEVFFTLALLYLLVVSIFSGTMRLIERRVRVLA